jgi:2-iminobutanoate/2-iminopropanoate deaminase
MSKKQVISTSEAPHNDAPYSQGILTEDLLFVSGQGPADPDTGEQVSGGVKAQTEQTLENLKSIVHSAGGSLENILKTTVYLGDMDDYDAMNGVYGEYFDSEPPARVCIEAGRLPRDIDVEIEALARMD